MKKIGNTKTLMTSKKFWLEEKIFNQEMAVDCLQRFCATKKEFYKEMMLSFVEIAKQNDEKAKNIDSTFFV